MRSNIVQINIKITRVSLSNGVLVRDFLLDSHALSHSLSLSLARWLSQSPFPNNILQLLCIFYMPAALNFGSFKTGG
ncbi:hypothetical protein NC653_003076 [Populus alba x Populus x berolinensis]|uniref:Uncharacterized protein n=1 Tax=Populus alba x Populus x berolinensis TaxID=444605 RepID=A0AAD6WHM8_9ROSI|nr:hypothetical protein NC653_003076 [Populus alba x Populus x berolinensis]